MNLVLLVLQPHRHAHFLVKNILLPYFEGVVYIYGPFPISDLAVLLEDADFAVEQNEDPLLLITIILHTLPLLHLPNLKRLSHLLKPRDINVPEPRHLSSSELDKLRNGLDLSIATDTWML